ncbi:MAG: hypothetical protein KGK01_19140 [Bradyrhizobium sp.]|uniref:hypothetical protein n=1 Tax=Bradyrhizobium sp. TaxID=376 RepID=UPI001C28E43E|nr:hypothetical protein [Bradyrhizobium sp.]MBU6462732.1 hypothetical protein [Pseudomonadota bacterium]MDE2067866.1 hypothetical protein [Bradyrhizobium sp.]MDE2244457.1 hypothetical protein [Bradyrhizobium sp.]MDE2470735.1 hypothetical protein [Bradyrhizobium sp.]
MEPRQFLRSGITASALVHLSCLMLVIFFTEVHPFGSVTAEPISVDIVAPEEVAGKAPEPQLPLKKGEENPEVSPDTPAQPDLSAKADSSAKAVTASSSPSAAAPLPAAKPAPAATPQKQAAPAPPSPAPASTPALTAAPDPGKKAAAPLPAVQPAYSPAQPDLSVKYHVLLGLPQERPGDGFDAPAIESADVARDLISEFRRHLKTCSTLPKEIAPSDKLAIKLRVLMTPEGRLAAKPVLIEASASVKGPLLMQSAISALQACQPYTMLPPDHYQEWKILDLNFTPQDFINAS